jgi:hypothetical protein
VLYPELESPAMWSKGSVNDLVGLATAWLTRRGLYALCPVEKKFLQHVQNGDSFNGGQEEIRGAIISFLCGNNEAQKLVDPHGIWIEQAKISGEKLKPYDSPALYLSSIIIPFPLILHTCDLPSWILLQGVEIPFLDLDGSKINSIAADVLKVRGDLYLRKTYSEGTLNFSGATIGGDFDCSGAMINHKSPSKDCHDASTHEDCLIAEGIHVSGDLLMTDLCQSKGRVCLDGAHIDGDVKCDSGLFSNPGRDALTLRHAVVGGDVLFGRGFKSEGAVRLPGATIGGNLNCAGGVFNNPRTVGKVKSAVALEVDGTEIKLDLNLAYERDDNSVRFTANGTTSLVGTRVGRIFRCEGGHFLNTEPDLLDALPRWRPALELKNAQVAYLHFAGDLRKNKDKGRVDRGQLRLDGFVYGRISNRVKWKECLAWIDMQYAENSAEFFPQPYLQLAKVLREEGDPGGAKKILFEMEKTRSKAFAKKIKAPRNEVEPIERTEAKTKRSRGLVRQNLSRAWRSVKKATIGYGYYPEWALRWLAALCLFGCLVFHVQRERFIRADKDAYSSFASLRYKPDNYITFNPFLLSVENSLPILKFGQSEHWRTRPEPLPKLSQCWSWLSWAHFLGIFIALQIMAGWFLATMGIAGLTGLIRKE